VRSNNSYINFTPAKLLVSTSSLAVLVIVAMLLPIYGVVNAQSLPSVVRPNQGIRMGYPLRGPQRVIPIESR